MRILASETGGSFSPPQSFDQADAEIKRMKRLKKNDYSDRRRERHQISADMSAERGGSSRVADVELCGYGSTATWADPYADEED